LLLAFKALPSLEEPNKFPAWLNAITRRCAIRFSQQVQRQNKRNVALDEVLLEQVPALSRSMPENGADEELRNALRKIPDDYALAIQLHFMDDMPLQRIAGYLGVSLAVVKWRIHRGKSLLREQFRLLTERRKLWKRKMNYRA
jgi:RNA polymerase sigma-70 factor (ECF subfamily)